MGYYGKVARAHGYRGDMRNLTRGQALEILETDYWYGPRFDRVAKASPDVAAELCDTGVNMGPSVAAKMLQRWLNVFNQWREAVSGYGYGRAHRAANP